MSSSSSFRARLESLPLRYSAPAGGYAPMPSPDDAPGIGDRGEETGPRIKVGPDGYGVVVTTGGASAPSGPSAATPSAGSPTVPPATEPAAQPAAASASTPENPAAPIYGVVQAPAPAGYGVVQPRPKSPESASPQSPDVLDSPIFGAVSSAASGASASSPVEPAAPRSAASPAPDDVEAPDATAASAPSEPSEPSEPPAHDESPAPTAIAWESVASAASDAAAIPLSQQTAQEEPEDEETPAGGSELPQLPEEPEPETDDQELPDGVPEDGVYVDVDVAIVMESTYPYLKGGVSAVVHDIITGNPDLTFGIIHITWDSHSPRKDLYGMPDNIAWVKVLYLSMEEHQEDFLRARPRDLHMNRRQRRELSRRILGALLSLAQDGQTEPLWDLISEGLSASRRYPVWAILGTREFMEAYHDMMPDLGMSMTDIFWCLRDFFSLAYAVLAEPVPRAQVYHAHTTGYAMLLGVNAAREHGTKVLLTEHNLYVRDTVNTLLERRLDLNVRLTDYRTFDVTGRERMWMAWWLEMGRLCYPYAYASTYLYPRAITEANELGGDSGRAIVIPNGIVTSEFDASYAARLAAIEEIKKEGADKHLWKLVYIARVVPIKGLLDMIDSVRLMVDRGLNIHLDVCGPTEHMPSYFEQCLTRIVEQGLESVITIRGTVKVRELLPEFDLFVLPSYNEGLPVVSLETMGAGIPTVSTDVGAVRSVVEDMIVTDDGQTWDPCGIIIEPGDPAVMADKVQEVISDVDLYERLSLNARGRVEAAYDLVKVNASYNKIYRQGGAGEQAGARADRGGA
ncbi:glycosyl transferase family 1 [Actinomyces oris]|uniref:GT4 family glycosyltransferase PelF n=2 Tax=Actinomyces TaxID=1654 RepID=A0AAW9KR54_9ACTO|nr:MULTISPECIES: GT4 family glycosyltransferase PelF [Actinomyces]MEA1305722.1 GT4 family glycosyltransferase PelF [Actinomyces oris]OLO59610.1 glycosyl transferase family 1 [Actinomyces oris]